MRWPNGFAISVRVVYRLIDDGEFGVPRSGAVCGFRYGKFRGTKRSLKNRWMDLDALLWFKNYHI